MNILRKMERGRMELCDRICLRRRLRVSSTWFSARIQSSVLSGKEL